MSIKYKTVCGCGCGQETGTDRSGHPRRFLRGHNHRGRGSGWIEKGYHYINRNGKKIAVHRTIVEARLGRPLTSSEIVHHLDHNPRNNRPENLCLLSRAEHMRLHGGCKKPRWTHSEKERAWQLHGAGFSTQEIARMVGRPFSSTQYNLQRLKAARQIGKNGGASR